MLESSLTARVGGVSCFVVGEGGGVREGEGRGEIPYLRTSSKCFRWDMITSRCFSRIARAMKRWNWLL